MNISKFFIFVLVLFVSCGRQEDEKEDTFKGVETLGKDDAKELTEDQLIRAKRICASLTIKRRNIINDLVGKKKFFNFSRSSLNCRGNLTRYQDVRASITAPLNPKEELKFVALDDVDTNSPLLVDVLTDKSAIMQDFCLSLLEQKKVLDVITYREYSYRYIFPEKEEDTIEIITYVSVEDSEDLKASRADRLSVSFDDEDKGFLKSRISAAFCSDDPKRTMEVRQTTDFL